MTAEKCGSTRSVELLAKANMESTIFPRQNSIPNRNCHGSICHLNWGLFLGARKFGGRAHSRKKTLIFDRQSHRYQALISDIAGQDIHSHNGSLDSLIEQIAAWLRDEVGEPDVPGEEPLRANLNDFVSNCRKSPRRNTWSWTN